MTTHQQIESIADRNDAIHVMYENGSTPEQITETMNVTNSQGNQDVAIVRRVLFLAEPETGLWD